MIKNKWQKLMYIQYLFSNMSIKHQHIVLRKVVEYLRRVYDKHLSGGKHSYVLIFDDRQSQVVNVT